MSGWRNPGAFWGMLLLAVPIAIHLLRKARAERVLFPSVRFVPASRLAAVRLRNLSELLLLAVRVAIIAAAVTALAQPVVTTSSRVAAWNSRLARAVIVDATDSMRATGADGVSAATAGNRTAELELKTAEYARRFDARKAGEEIPRVVRWLETTPPSRKEIVFVSDFQRGSIDKAACEQIPAAIGLRFAPVGVALGTQRVAGFDLLGADGGAAAAQVIELTPDSTSVAVDVRPRPRGHGLRLVLPPERAGSAAALLRVLAAAEAPAGSDQRPVAIQFDGRQAAAGLMPLSAGWMLQVAHHVQADRVLAATYTVSMIPREAAASEPWTILVRDRDSTPLVRSARLDREMLVDIGAPADSLFAAMVVRRVLSAARPASDYAEQEIARVPDAALAAWSRQPAPSDSGAWRTADSSDARWCWGAVLALFGLEQWLRNRAARRATEEIVRAAA